MTDTDLGEEDEASSEARRQATMEDHPGFRLAWDAEVDGITALPYEVIAPIQWRSHPPPDEKTHIEVHDAKKDRWRRLKIRWVPFFEALSEGMPFPEIRERVERALPDSSDVELRYLMKRLISMALRWRLIRLFTPPPPERFHDRYRVLERLGEGGMGIVWLCADEEDGDRPVAVKHAWNKGGPFRSRDRHLREEGEVMQALEHETIVRFLDEFEVDGRYHLVREVIDGRKLSSVCRSGLDEPTRTALMEDVVQGMAAMAQQGWWFLDAKPGNYFVNAEGRAILADLGGMKPRPSDGTLRTRSGTHRYMAPEVLRHARVTEASLVYSMGIFHRQLIARKAPPKLAALATIQAGAAERGGSEWELDVLARCCAPDPADRVQTLAELADLFADRHDELGRDA